MAQRKPQASKKHHHPSAFVGLALLLPFLILNYIVANGVEPFFSWIRPGLHTGNLEYIVLFITIFLIPVGIYIAMHPMLQKVEKGEQKYFLLNVLVAIALSMIFIMLVSTLGAEIYYCDILHIPNCD